MRQDSLFWTSSKHLAELNAMGDPLEKLDKAIDWRMFEPMLEKAFCKERKSNAGRPSYDYILMFKILVLQHLYNLSDEQTQYQILDRHSFRRFLGLGNEDQVPDQKTVWLFRETLTQCGAVRKLFDKFDGYLSQAGYRAQKGQIVDAAFVEVPRQRNNRQENDHIRNGSVPPHWKKKPAKLRQKDLDARWTKKNGQRHYGYKNHLNVDVKHKLIRNYQVTPANVHDSQVFSRLEDKDNTGRGFWGDSAYRSLGIDRKLKRRGRKNNIQYKGCRNHPLTARQKALNRLRSAVRARVEHVNERLDSMIGRWIRTIGIIRAQARIGMTNLAYNLRRYAYLECRA